MASVSASRFTDLKARVKSECQRRNKTGSVATYGGTDYDYSVAPASGGTILSEHRDKLKTPLSKINSSVISASNSSSLVNDADLTAMEAFVTTCEKRTIKDAGGTDCASSCTGLCYGCTDSCTDSCTSCWDACWGRCTNNCTGCSGTCTGDCSGTCTDNCTGCSGGCGGTCTATCADSCQVDCSSGCWTGCQAGCTGNG